ncbi:MAG: hydrogenase iron-sulfur subunit, partial [Verrucomicrobiales bacterium]|nr:hydrogenase iron-sulfur subunit [Verrucomicrobiales bacterium]
EGLLRRLENGWLYLDRLVQAFIPPALNPFGQLGAIANTCLIIAVLSGIALLFWYSPSVHHAYESIEKIRTTSWLGQLMRSLHRYSSDGCLFFILLHALRITFQRRFTGARWLAWTTGILMLALLWFIGWTGYWLVWDVRAQHTALGTARFIDRLPIFAEPLSRSFLTDQSVPSLLFFLIFFVHMLAPLAMGVGIWMHLMRVNRSKFLTGRAMTMWVAGSLLLLSALWPALSASPAQMTVKAQKFTIDLWYLWPFALTDRLSGGALWAFFLFTGSVALTVPWWMTKGRRAPAWKAQVDLPRCMGCTLCAQDCPFNAITMVPREDGRKFAVQSQVNPSLCVGCGICTGSCDSQAINLPALNSRDVEKRLHAWLDARKVRGERPFVAFACAESAGALLGVDAEGNSAALPGYRVEPVPCVGWVSAVLLERTLRRGAAGILVVGCGAGDAVAREGMKWFAQRMEGRREPKFDPGKADPARVRFVQFDRTRGGELSYAARQFQQQAESFSPFPINVAASVEPSGTETHRFPSPRPSPLGRGRIVRRFLERSKRLLFSNERPTCLPLPEGEGRGEGKDSAPAHTSPLRHRVLQIAAAVVLVFVLGTVTYAFSNLPYRTPHSSEPELVVSFNHSGAILEPRKLTKEELAKRLPHMRAQINVTRERVPVRLRVQVDGQTVLDRSYQPKGLSHDGPSMAVARLPMAPGAHYVRVELADTADPGQWTQQWSETVEFQKSRARVVLFDTKAGFSLH